MSYKKPSVTVDIAVLTCINDLEVLLIKRKNNPFKNCWALPGGFLDMDETLEQSAIRELKEETGIVPITGLSFFGIYDNPKRDPRDRVITVVYKSFVSYRWSQEQVIKAADDAAELQWWSMHHLPARMAFDHKKILKDMLEQIKRS